MKILQILLTLTICYGSVPGQPRQETPSGESTEIAAVANEIDRLILDDLHNAGIKPARLCSDEVFIRRVYLDTIGTLPTPDEVRSFLDDDSSNKRSILIDQLLEREEFADYWSLKWCDLLRVKSEYPINLWPNAVQAYHRWIRDSIKTNKPYDQFARQLLTSSGSNFRVPPVNFYRAMPDHETSTIARTVVLTFMGERIEHWPEDKRSDLENLFSRVAYKKTAEWKEEIVYPDPTASTALNARLHSGQSVKIPPGDDPRRAFADWLIAPDNPKFTQPVVNRIWYWLFGIGIIHEPDDIRPDNLPINPQLLAYLQQELVKSEYDLKHIYRLILNSNTYQRSSIPASNNPEAERRFANYSIRRLDAEVLIDAICRITDTTESYSSLIPEPFTFIPGENHSIALADGSITSRFLDLFGRPSRDSGLAAERHNNPTDAQKLHLLNSSHINNKLKNLSIESASRSSDSEKRKTRRSRRNSGRAKLSPETVTELYLLVLSRYPTENELAIIKDYEKHAEAKGKNVLIDITWALINTPEFLYRH